MIPLTQIPNQVSQHDHINLWDFTKLLIPDYLDRQGWMDAHICQATSYVFCPRQGIICNMTPCLSLAFICPHVLWLLFFFSTPITASQADKTGAVVMWDDKIFRVDKDRISICCFFFFYLSSLNNNHSRLLALERAEKRQKRVSAFIRTKGGWAGEHLTSQ